MRRTTAGLVALLSLYLLYVFCVIPWQGNKVAKSLEATTLEAIAGNPTALAFIQDERNLAAASRWRSRLRDDANLNIAVASIFNLAGRPDEALAIYQDALRFDRRPEMYFNRAGIKLGMGDVSGAIEDYLYAARFNPRLTRRIRTEAVRLRVQAELERIRPARVP